MKPMYMMLLCAFCVALITFGLIACDQENDPQGSPPIFQPSAENPSWNISELSSLNSSDNDEDDWGISLDETGTIMFFSTQNVNDPDPDRCPYGMHSVALRSNVDSSWGGPFVGSDGDDFTVRPGLSGTIIQDLGSGFADDYEFLVYVSGPQYTYSPASARPGAIPTTNISKQSDIYLALVNDSAEIDPDDRPTGDYFDVMPFLVGGDTTVNHFPLTGASSTNYHETTPFLLYSDGDTLVFFARSSVTGATNFDIYVVEVSSSTPSPISAINESTSNEIYPYVTSVDDSLRLYFASDRGAGGDYDIWVSTYSGTSWGSPVLAPGVNHSSYNELAPCFRPDLNEYYFSSDRNNAGHYDLYVAAYY